MRKILKVAVFTLLAAIVVSMPVSANDNIRVTIDGQHVGFDNQHPQIIDGRTLVPVRGVFEQLGFEVQWQGALQQATLASDDYTVVLIIGSANFTTNGVRHTLDVPAQVIGGSTMLPLRAVLESVGYDLGWRGEHCCDFLNDYYTRRKA